MGLYMQSMARWEGDEVGGKEGSGGSYTESCRSACGGQELAKNVAVLDDDLQK